MLEQIRVKTIFGCSYTWRGVGLLGTSQGWQERGTGRQKKTWGPNSLGGPKILLKRLVMGATVKRVMGV